MKQPNFTNDRKEFKKFIELNKNKLIFIKFYATWCNPCTKIKDIVHTYYNEVKGNTLLLEIDVDKYTEIASLYRVNRLPTIISIKDGMLDNVVMSSNNDDIKQFFRIYL